MSAITSPLGVGAVVAVLFLSLLFANLSRRLSAVNKQTYHRLSFRIATDLIAIAAFSQIVRASANLAPDKAIPALLTPTFALLAYHLPLTVGVTLCLVQVVRHWGWIIREDLEQ